MVVVVVVAVVGIPSGMGRLLSKRVVLVVNDVTQGGGVQQQQCTTAESG